ncbi:tetraacyldisaccharide 4'-kinase [archaeon]|nr:tetraacyldisaccharide 4'-kinase [archaeon]
MELNQELLNLLICPSCKSKIQYYEYNKNLICSNCRKEYPVDDDIPIFIKE